jgi:hypothetical protein
MTLLIVLLVLLALAVAGPLLGTDTRSSSGWHSGDPDGPLWADSGVRAH